MTHTASPVAPVECTLAVDVGGSSVKVAYGTADGQLHDLRSVPIEEVRSGGDVVAGIVGLVAGRVATPPPRLRPVSVGIVVPGIVDEAAGIARLSLILGWRDVPLRERLQDAIGLATVVGHDVGAAAIAEGRLGAARGRDDWLFLALGTGLGSAFVLHGRPYRGTNGFGGELAHVVAVPGGPLCRCGKRGCLEMIASASAIGERYRELSAGGDVVTAAEVARRSRCGDPVAARVWAEGVDALATVVAGAVESLNPGAVVVGGGLAQSGRQLLDPFREALLDQIRFVEPRPDVLLAQLGMYAGVHGAALLGLDELAPAPSGTLDAGPS